ncbi:unnamed protein product [Leptidea sinapis]|uniref:Uncharacterized protein n=1 Tax=Leptidea sinapis TaxID=189913 RepID=A0A5E4Q550_9NEOP|nr:unnamed protein product [Leptidea sinapis]
MMRSSSRWRSRLASGYRGFRRSTGSRLSTARRNPHQRITKS